MRCFSSMFILVFLGIFTITANANFEEEAAKAYKENRFSDMVSILESAANKGDVKAQNMLGKIYRDGHEKINITKNLGIAHDWFLKAAKQGSSHDMIELSLLYFYQPSIKNISEGERWMLRAAELGQPHAQYNLSQLYFSGLETIKKNREKAFHWGLKAANQSHVEAMVGVSSAYSYGWGVDKNLGAAYEWRLKAAQVGHVHSQMSIAHGFLRDGMSGLSYENAASWFKKAADQGYPSAKEKYAWVKSIMADPHLVYLEASPYVETLTIFYSLGCHKCLSFFYEHLEYLLQQNLNGNINLLFRETPYRLSDSGKAVYGKPNINVKTPSYYTHCIRSVDGYRSFAKSLFTLAKLAKTNISETGKGRNTMDWTYMAFAKSDNLHGKYATLQALYSQLLVEFDIEPRQCDKGQYQSYITHIENENSSAMAGEYIFKGKKYKSDYSDPVGHKKLHTQLMLDLKKYISASQR